MEMLPLGPVLFIDTAGLDDTGALGAKRVAATRKIFDRADVAVIVSDSGDWSEFEEELIREFRGKKIPFLVVLNKIDVAPPNQSVVERLEKEKIPYMTASALKGENIGAFRELLVEMAPESLLAPSTIIGDLVNPGDLVVIVVPIDLEAPKGRLIMPQVQTIRDVLDNDAYCTVVKERELRDALENTRRKPALVVTDSQAFLKVAGDTPDDVPMTSFSILFARYKGDLRSFVEGAKAIDTLKTGDKILIAEACSHHPIGEDIGRVKIPRWLTRYVGGKLDFTFIQGHDFPEDVSMYKLVIHCGSCTFNPRSLMSRIIQCESSGVPITNYGVAIAFSLGIFDRALRPFEYLLDG
jgi:[FeFe] hydrogenase H-cluster maturation GTPase HydF